MTPRVLALDLSMTATGIARPDGYLSTYSPGAANLGDQRLTLIRNKVRHLVIDTEPALVAIEGPVTRSQAATTIGMVHGAVRVELMDTGDRYLLVPPAVLKKYATGKGNAPKPDMRMALYKRTGADVADDNQVDAAWLRLIALDLLGHPEVDMPAAQRDVLGKLASPWSAAA